MAKIEYLKDFEALDTALYEKLSGLVLPDERPVPVTYYDPDIELTQREDNAEQGYYPAIVIYRQAEVLDNMRYGVDRIRDNEKFDADGTLINVDVREAPEPWTIYYSIRLLADSQQDLVQLKAYYRRTLPTRFSYIEVDGVKYDVYQVNYSVAGGAYKEFGAMGNGNRVFGDTYVIKIEVNVDVYDRETKGIITDVIIRPITQIP